MGKVGVGLGLTHCAYRIFPLLIEQLSFLFRTSFDSKLALGRVSDFRQAAKKHRNSLIKTFLIAPLQLFPWFHFLFNNLALFLQLVVK